VCISWLLDCLVRWHHRSDSSRDVRIDTDRDAIRIASFKQGVEAMWILSIALGEFLDLAFNLETVIWGN